MTDGEFDALCDLAVKAVGQIDQIMAEAGTRQLMDIVLVKVRDKAKSTLGAAGANIAGGALQIAGYGAGAAGNVIGAAYNAGAGLLGRLGGVLGGAAQAAADNYLPFGGLFNAAVQAGAACVKAGAGVIQAISSLSIEAVQWILSTMISSIFQWIFQTGPNGPVCARVDFGGLLGCVLAVLSMSPKYSLGNLLAVARTMEERCEERNSGNLSMQELVHEVLDCVRKRKAGIGPLYGILCSRNRRSWREHLLRGGNSASGGEDSNGSNEFNPSNMWWRKRKADSMEAQRRAHLLAELCATFDEIFYLLSGMTVLGWVMATAVKPNEKLVDSMIIRGVARGIGFIDRGFSYLGMSVGEGILGNLLSWILTTRICPRNKMGMVAPSKYEGDCVREYKGSIYRCIQKELVSGDSVLSLSRLARLLPDFHEGKFRAYAPADQRRDLAIAIQQILTCIAEGSGLDIVHDIADGMDRMLHMQDCSQDFSGPTDACLDGKTETFMNKCMASNAGAIAGACHREI